MSSNQIRVISAASYPILPNVNLPSSTPMIVKSEIVEEKTASNQDTPYKQIMFADGVSIIISKQWYDAYEKLREPVILRNGTLFKNIVYPLLTGESLVYMKSGNPVEEFGHIISEISYYGVPLKSQQMYDIASNCGLVEYIQSTKQYINSKTYCIGKYHKGYKKRFDKFADDWKRYLDILTARHASDRMERFTAESLTEMLLSFDFQTIFVINMQKFNIIFEYVDWFTKVVMKKDLKCLGNYIEGLIVNKDANANSWIEAQLMSLPVDEAIKNKIATIMNNASIMSDFIGTMKKL